MSAPTRIVVITDSDQTDDHIVATLGLFYDDEANAALDRAEQRYPQTGTLSYTFCRLEPETLDEPAR